MSYFDFLILSLILKNIENQLTYKILKKSIILETFKIKKIVYVKPKCYLEVGVKNCDTN